MDSTWVQNRGGRMGPRSRLPPPSLSTPLTPQTSVCVPTARLGALTHTHTRPEQRTEALVLKSSSSALCTRQAKSLWKRSDTSRCFLSGSQVALTRTQHLGLVLSTWNRAHKIHSWMNDARLRRAAVSADLGTGMSATGAMLRPPTLPYRHDSESGVCEALLFQRFLSRPRRPGEEAVQAGKAGTPSLLAVLRRGAAGSACCLMDFYPFKQAQVRKIPG